MGIAQKVRKAQEGFGDNMNYTRKQWIAILTTWLLLVPLSYGWVNAEESQAKCCTILYGSPSDLIDFNKAISGLGIFTFLSDKSAPERVDEIFNKVVEILWHGRQSFPRITNRYYA